MDKHLKGVKEEWRAQRTQCCDNKIKDKDNTSHLEIQIETF